MHWIADYCMAKLQTDDEIPASECIAKESGHKFQSDCAAKIRYKRAMCRTAIADKRHRGPLSACVRDPAFVGHTVRNGGVGG